MMAEWYFFLKSRRKATGVLVALFGLVCAAPRTSAQGAMKCHTMETRPEVAPEDLPPPQKLIGIGNAHIRITATSEAQKWFDQGLNLLHALFYFSIGDVFIISGALLWWFGPSLLRATARLRMQPVESNCQ